MSDFEAHFLDIGEGDATLLRMPGESWVLIDVFRCEDHGSVDLFRVLDDKLPLGSSGKRRLDLLIVTHAHDDHIRGLADLVKRYEVTTIWAPRYKTEKKLGERYEEFKKVMEEHDDVVVPKGSRSPIAHFGPDDEVTVRCFSPPGWIDVDEELSEEDARKLVHEHCGVFRFDYAGVAVMFCGDSDRACWKRIEGYYKDRTDENDLSVLESQVQHASHHGSRTFFMESKDDEPWAGALRAIKPEAVVVSVGAENKHDHPHDEAMELYRDEAGEENVLETQDSNTITLAVDSDGGWTLTADDGSWEQNYGWDADDEDEAAKARARWRPRTRLDESAAA